MTECPTTVTPNTTIAIAVTMMMNKNISCLPVIEDGVVKGVLTTTDLLLSLQCSLQILMKIASDGELLERVLGILAGPRATACTATDAGGAAESNAFNESDMIAIR